jgi:hypothetical protein
MVTTGKPSCDCRLRASNRLVPLAENDAIATTVLDQPHQAQPTRDIKHYTDLENVFKIVVIIVF